MGYGLAETAPSVWLYVSLYEVFVGGGDKKSYILFTKLGDFPVYLFIYVFGMCVSQRSWFDLQLPVLKTSCPTVRLHHVSPNLPSCQASLGPVPRHGDFLLTLAPAITFQKRLIAPFLLCKWWWVGKCSVWQCSGHCRLSTQQPSPFPLGNRTPICLGSRWNHRFKEGVPSARGESWLLWGRDSKPSCGPSHSSLPG